MADKSLQIYGKQAVFHTGGHMCADAQALVGSRFFLGFLTSYLGHLRAAAHPVLEQMDQLGEAALTVEQWQSLFAAICQEPLEAAALRLPHAVDLLAPARRKGLMEFVQGFYDFWRSYNRYMVLHAGPGSGSPDPCPYAAFDASIEAFTHLVRGLYRGICENVSGDHPHVYRQVPAGCNAGFIAAPKASPMPPEMREVLGRIPFVRQTVIVPPMLLDPPSNTRTGSFQEVDCNPVAGLDLDPREWLCYPAQVGPMVIFLYFHLQFVGLGCALANLFELATDRQIAAGPGAVFVYGAPSAAMERFGELPTVFHRDPSGLLVGAVPLEPRFGYFGYLKKMALTMHNIAMLDRGRLPFHGAMVRIMLRSGRTASVLIIGDTATGKSESLEAFRTLGAGRIREMRIVADDMGSLQISPGGRIQGFGTEIGAFVRLDDLQLGYAFGTMDRAIFMNPQKVNARVVLPVTTLDEVLAGFQVDYLLYANNYEPVGEGRPVLERFPDLERALEVFSAGQAMSKGTTSETGLTGSYFANPFGAPQFRELHEGIARRTFEAAYAAGVFVGQIRTRLAVPGMASEGPRAVAEALLESLDETPEAAMLAVTP
jgi:hypothetical protein